MVDAMQFHSYGGPQVLRPVQLALATPGSGEVRLRHTAIALNYIDTYYRNGLYPVTLPAIPGIEGVGIIEEVGPDVTFAPGTRVAYARGPLGAYATERLIAAKELVVLPDSISDLTAASVFMKGLTAWYLLHQTYPVRAGDTILVHAAAGGVGLLLSQWAKQLGCQVIGTAGSAEKGALARQHGCDDVILYRHESVAAKVKELTGGAGVAVVYDAVGKSTFIPSLDALQPFGLMVSYGQASGPIPAFDLRELASRGSLFITRPSLMDYMKDDGTYQKASAAVFGKVADGSLKVTTAQTFALKEAVQAHQALEGRHTTGSTVLVL